MDEKKLLYLVLTVSILSLVVGLLVLYSLKTSGVFPPVNTYMYDPGPIN